MLLSEEGSIYLALAERSQNVAYIARNPEALMRALKRRDGEGNMIPVDPRVLKLSMEVAQAKLMHAREMMDKLSKEVPNYDEEMSIIGATILPLQQLIDRLEDILGGSTR